MLSLKKTQSAPNRVEPVTFRLLRQTMHVIRTYSDFPSLRLSVSIVDFITIFFVLFYFLESMISFLELVAAGIAGSPHMISATIISVSKIVYEFRGKPKACASATRRPESTRASFGFCRCSGLKSRSDPWLDLF